MISSQSPTTRSSNLRTGRSVRASALLVRRRRRRAETAADVRDRNSTPRRHGQDHDVRTMCVEQQVDLVASLAHHHQIRMVALPAPSDPADGPGSSRSTTRVVTLLASRALPKQPNSTLGTRHTVRQCPTVPNSMQCRYQILRYIRSRRVLPRGCDVPAQRGRLVDTHQERSQRDAPPAAALPPSPRRLTRSLSSRWCTWFLTVRNSMPRLAAISLSVQPRERSAGQSP